MPLGLPIFPNTLPQVDKKKKKEKKEKKKKREKKVPYCSVCKRRNSVTLALYENCLYDWFNFNLRLICVKKKIKTSDGYKTYIVMFESV